MKYLIYFLLNLMLIPSVSAEDILNLQQKASFAYKLMKQAVRDAKTAEQQAKAKEERLRDLRQKIAEAEQEYETAYNKSKEANTRMELARRNWNELTSRLMQEWVKQENIR